MITPFCWSVREIVGARVRGRRDGVGWASAGGGGAASEARRHRAGYRDAVAERARCGPAIKHLLPADQARVSDDQRGLRFCSRGVSRGRIAHLLKRSATAELVTAIREVINGRSYVTPLVTAGLVGSFMQPQDKNPLHLTARQREVLQLLAEGFSMKQVADMLNVHASHRPVSQVQHDAAARHQVERRAHSVCRAATHCLSRACCWSTTTRQSSIAW